LCSVIVRTRKCAIAILKEDAIDIEKRHLGRHVGFVILLKLGERARYYLNNLLKFDWYYFFI
jgi:hypothetical protein